MNGSYDRKHLEKIANKVLNGEATKEEELFLNEYYNAFEKNPDVSADLTADEIRRLDHEIKTEIDQKIFIDQKIRSPFKIGYKIIAAAVVLVVLAVAVRYARQAPVLLNSSQDLVLHDIAPGGNKATLQLANGKIINLSDAENGTLASQNGISIKKSGDGILTYDVSKFTTSSSETALSYNTISTPRGGQYNIVLSDGSKVSLNAASSLKFPTSFSGKERNVELTGEAYFEVAKNAKMPFHVKSAGQTIEVLGTHFDVNAYKDEPAVKTTLLEGSVKVFTAKAASVILKPGQQSALFINRSDETIRVSDHADVDEVMAWKNGMFQFNDADIKTVMRQISRWYNVNVEFEGKIPSDHYKGKVPRNVNVSQVLKILELSGVNFKIEGDKIIVK